MGYLPLTDATLATWYTYTIIQSTVMSHCSSQPITHPASLVSLIPLIAMFGPFKGLADLAGRSP